MERKKILFCNAFKAPYIDTEKEIFKQNFDVIFYEYSISKTIYGKVISMFKNLYVALKYVPRIDAVYSIFGGFHGFFPIALAKLIGKKTVITIGGYDGVNIPSIKFGVFYQSNLLSWCVKKEFIWADYLLPVDKSLELSTNYYADPSGTGYPIGIRNFVDTNSNIVEIPFGYDFVKFQKIPSNKKRIGVLSIGWATTDQVFLRKGFDLVLKVADLLPDVLFTIAGISTQIKEHYNGTTPPNVSVLEFIDHDTMIELCSLHKIFLQLSLSEGLPNTLCEAMLCECIPIGSNVNGIPKAIGDTGFILNKKDPIILKELISEALLKPDNYGQLARERIIKMFPLEKRVDSLISIFND